MKLPSVLLIGIFAVLGSTVHAATPDQWRSRSVYQLLTDRFARTDTSTTSRCNTEEGLYCGGTWRGVINKLDYIQNMGFTAIYISPITFNIEGDTGYGYGYHGFWQQNIYELNSNFGSAQDLRDLAQALHDRGMYLMVDIVVNHFAWPGAFNTITYSKFTPFNQASDYHSYCLISDYDNQSQVENCWLGDDKVLLPDLNTQDPRIASTLNDWVRSIVSNYSIDGLRIDTVKHIDKLFFPDFVSSSGVFATGEVLDGDPGYLCDYQNYLPSVFNYPAYYQAIAAFTNSSGSIANLANSIDAIKNTCKDTTLLGSFTENHDMPRFASKTQDISQAKSIIAYTILADGIPFIYAGQEQHYAGGKDPYNREATWLSGYKTDGELYKLVQALNQVRNRAIYVADSYLAYKNYPIWNDANTIAMRKGFDGNQIVAVLSNRGAGSGSVGISVPNHGFAAGTQLLDVLGCAMVTVDGNGYIQTTIVDGVPKVFYPLLQTKGSGICGM
ncbi:alpha-amylase [Pseudovirgaria hyperparasitica]|uniref:alpha-amylase n=1 Tax=Pseudovirgaria hyperparasitica TaxID=470096 RepID=A0A6A6WJ48_9PEZI|nr:alpha-amylase [Pseudovirgaria hyperparasitica]KAF2762409.1 alpha-amylase [Pseudovirgaria hyperparasitica]